MEPQPPAPDRTGPYITVEDAATYALCGKRRIEAAMASGALWSSKPGRRRLTTTAAVDAWILTLGTEEAA